MLSGSRCPQRRCCGSSERDHAAAVHASLLCTRPKPVAPKVDSECCVALLILRIASEYGIEIVDRTDVFPSVRAEVLECRDHDRRLEHVVEYSLQKVHHEVLFEARARCSREAATCGGDALDVLFGDH